MNLRRSARINRNWKEREWDRNDINTVLIYKIFRKPNLNFKRMYTSKNHLKKGRVK